MGIRQLPTECQSECYVCPVMDWRPAAKIMEKRLDGCPQLTCFSYLIVISVANSDTYVAWIVTISEHDLVPNNPKDVCL